MLKKIALGFVLFLVVAAPIAWFNRVDLALALLSIGMSLSNPVGPHREVTWQQGPEEPEQPATERPPNIIFILADDLGYNDVSTFGGGVAGGRVTTPGIDQLAAEGVVYEQSYAGSPICSPSRAMILTGRYPTRTGYEFTPMPPGMIAVAGLAASASDSDRPPSRRVEVPEEEILPFEQQGLPSSEVTIAEVLKARGYYTAHIGKWHLGRSQGFAPNDQGFDDSLFMASAMYLPEDDPGVVNAKPEFDSIGKFQWAAYNYAASFNNTGSDRFEPGGYLTDYWTDEAIKVIKTNRNRPFFLYLAHWGVHTPLQATKEDYEAVGDIKPHRLRVYAAMVRAVDRSVARINETVEELGLAENTIIIFSSDNGAPEYIGLPDVNKPFRGWKLTNFEGGLRVPMFIKWPSRIQPGTQVNKPVAHIDILPTLAAASGASLPTGLEIDGVDIVPLATGRAGAAWGRKTLFWQAGHYRGVRHGDWKLQVMGNPERTWLYNLAEDPTEQNDLSSLAPEKLAELQVLLADHQATGRKPLYPSVVELAVPVDKSSAEEFEEGDEFVYWPN